MWENLQILAARVADGVSEGLGDLAEGYVEAEVAKQQEAAKDPEVLKAVEPEKGTRTDGSTIVDTPQPKPFITGVDNTVVVVLGSLFIAGLGLALYKGLK